ncbi:NADH-ubiquinone oxidoreductase-F iron-sulfur binding region domain-containing protein [Streptomyces sp. NPDC047108]|uniref:NADH-ubiquinone oxidoreductase-F iron-sulfur binding region domain-containing protein n=1 Tax=Streptomyces sp. NPDC047108 TaxID=3155025 RepID=UPI0033DB7B94
MTGIQTLMPDGPPGLLGTDPAATESAAAYAEAGGYADTLTPDRLLERLSECGLRGRGGAGFPVAVKLRTVRDAGGSPVVVANGEEGEPGSAKDRWLLRARPHLVLDGLARAAAITGARTAYVYVSDPAAAERVKAALGEWTHDVPVEVVETAHTYVAGEETAVVRRIDGGPALPTSKPPRPYQEGVGGRPTLVSNVETLARIALIAARPDERGHRTSRSTLLTLSSGTARPLLTEAPYGTTLRTLAEAQGTPDARGALMGGLFGGLIGGDSLNLPLDPTTLTAAGTSLGCGAIRFLGPGECPASVAADAVDHLAAESARQCGICVAGTSSISTTLAALATGKADDDAPDKLLRWSSSLPGRGACGLLDASAGTAGSLLRIFPSLVRSHLDGPCPGCASSPPDGRRLVVPVPKITGIRSPEARIPRPSPAP